MSPITTGVLLFDDAEELDYVGPWEVLTMARSRRMQRLVSSLAWAAAPVLIALVSLGRRWDL